ncbi:MAG: ATP-binding protein [Bacteroidales bacterium]|nr:ATP-binding protein [Bacteroidales bacterium]
MLHKTSFYNIEKVIELGEGQFIEFKESFDKTIQKEIVAFANASGGIIALQMAINSISNSPIRFG